MVETVVLFIFVCSNGFIHCFLFFIRVPMVKTIVFFYFIRVPMVKTIGYNIVHRYAILTCVSFIAFISVTAFIGLKPDATISVIATRF